MKDQIIAQGAEAVLIKNGDLVKKTRIKKGYRLASLDEKLRKQRTKKEARLIEKASKIIHVPNIIKSNDVLKEIEMSFIEGKKLSETLDTLPDAIQVCKQIGKNIAKLHDADIIHGDLTTSNMILKGKDVFFIDFGLGYESKKTEDKAVDLHLIKQALEAKHFTNFQHFFNAIIEGYKISEKHKEVLKRLDAVEKRGRYKNAY